ncbi:MAG: protein kinase [Candidatus Eisenbacteria bacterium]
MPSSRAKSQKPKIESFDFEPGRILAKKYEVVRRLGGGWEGEVYGVRELSSKVERAAKLFFPHRNENRRASTRYARKLHKLRDTRVVIQYHTEEVLRVRGHDVVLLISELVEGELLAAFVKRQPKSRLDPFRAIHLLYAIVRGLEAIHRHGEYHGDLHSKNVIVARSGLSFDLKMLDMIAWNARVRECQQDDICDAIRIFYDSLGGAKAYSKQPSEVKEICRGLKRSLILERFPRASHLRLWLEELEWS